jgi:hypothetical protein
MPSRNDRNSLRASSLWIGAGSHQGPERVIIMENSRYLAAAEDRHASMSKLVGQIRGLFALLEGSRHLSEEDWESVVGLGQDLCAELQHRIRLLTEASAKELDTSA